MGNILLDSNVYAYLILPLLIFFARICDVTIGTIRIVFVSKGHKRVAPILGFFEVFIWIIAISQIMSNLNNFICYFAYAAGFATGNYVGLLVEERIAVGNLMIRVITSKDGDVLAKILNSHGFGATIVDAEGSSGKVNIIYSLVHRTNITSALKLIKDFNSEIFYSIEDIRDVNSGIFPEKMPLNFRFWRVGK
ncbi:MAG: DUF2179 domain-containing protein [Bacteroidales bacterium]|nr:DUF2179 domain-containing protein [Bacteroidales bacterium]